MKQTKKLPLSEVIYIAEAQEVQLAAQIFKSLENQVYKNFNVIVAYIEGAFDVEKFKQLVSETVNLPTDITIKYFGATDVLKLVDEALKTVDEDAEYIFIKSAMPNIWSNYHMLSHVEDWGERHTKNKMFQISNLSIRDIKFDIAHPYGALEYRVDSNVKADTLVLDEISFKKSAIGKFEFGKHLPADDDKDKGFKIFPFFDLMKTNGVFVNKEITVYQLIDVPKPPNVNDIILQNINTQYTSSSIISVDENKNIVEDGSENADLFVVEKFPTIAGNKQWDEKHNLKVIESIRQYEDTGKKFIKNIGVKRTMGMGDVILTQPFIKFLNQRYPDAKIYYYTMNNAANIQSITRFADCKIEEIKTYENQEAFGDLLSVNDELDLRFDLDLAYESRPENNYSKSYFEAMGYEVPEGFDLTPKFEIVRSVPIFLKDNKNKYIAICPNGSGWGGKELSIQMWKDIIVKIKELGYHVALASKPLDHFKELEKLVDYYTEFDNEVDSYNGMVQTIQYSDGYIGSDNGPMHIAISFGKPIVIFSGAALFEKTTNYNNAINIVKSDLPCIGCKHRFFFNIIQPQPNQNVISFVPNCDNSSQYECMKFDQSMINSRLEEFIAKL